MISRLSRLVAAFCAVILTTTSLMAQPVYELVNGRWYDDGAFHHRTFYTSNGMLESTRPSRVDSVVDLNGGFVIPALGEAHIHDLNEAESLEERLGDYVSRGIQYVMVQDALYPIGPQILARVADPSTPDVVYARGVVLPEHSEIATGMYRPLAEGGSFGPDRMTLESLDGHVVFLVNSEGDLDAKWERILALNEDIIKVVVAFSEDYDRRLRLPDSLGIPKPGLRADLLGPIVERAHASGRRVSVHIETAADFRLAIEAGADMVAHLPGWRIGLSAGYDSTSIEPWLLSEKDAAAASDAGAIVITTTLPKTFLPNWEAHLPKFNQIHAHNLGLLDAAGVTIAVGSDAGELTTGELLHLAQFGVFDNRALLDMATQVTPKVIFPDRRIGILSAGYEANFLVLDDSPLKDLNNLSQIRLQVKQGRIVK